MAIAWLLDRMKVWDTRPALIWKEKIVSYGEVAEDVSQWEKRFAAMGISSGNVVAIEDDYSPQSIAVLLALIDQSNIAVPLTRSIAAHKQEFMDVACVQKKIMFDAEDRWEVESTDALVDNELLNTLISDVQPGLILFSSGSTGKPKATLHNMMRFLTKFAEPQMPLRTIGLPLMDHVAGLDTLFYVLAGGGEFICVPDRSPGAVCRAIERNKAELLPTTATFLNLFLISEEYHQFDLSSLRIVAYGSEVMPEHVLARLRVILPQVKFLQKYGTTEFGSPRTRSKGGEDSLWFKIDGENIETKIVDNVLWVRSRSAMMGYLNAPDPFDSDGWINTGDMVEVEGEYIRVLGRRSEMINVGGLKVYPAEVENLILGMENIREVIVNGEKNPITGSIVVARVRLHQPESLVDLKSRIREYCKNRLAPYKVPVKIEIMEHDQFSERFKKIRRAP